MIVYYTRCEKKFMIAESHI